MIYLRGLIMEILRKLDDVIDGRGGHDAVWLVAPASITVDLNTGP